MYSEQWTSQVNVEKNKIQLSDKRETDIHAYE